MEGPPSMDPELVKEFVGKAHGDFDYVKNAIDTNPKIANASWDWGGGDWETGLGAAAHMGRRDIAEFLIANGARIDIFAAAMLGDLETVKAIIAFDSSSVTKLGPHGIPLIAHAERGGDQAAEVLAYLKAL